MGKNSQIHLFLETELLEALKWEADENKISISELCRQKLRECSKLTRIEILLEKLNSKISHKGEVAILPKAKLGKIAVPIRAKPSKRGGSK